MLRGDEDYDLPVYQTVVYVTLHLGDEVSLVQAFRAYRAAGEVGVEEVVGAFVERDHHVLLGPDASLGGMVVGEPCFAEQCSAVLPYDEEAYVSVLPCAVAHPCVAVGALGACVVEYSYSSVEEAYVA